MTPPGWRRSGSLEDLKSLACALQAELAADLDVSVRAHHADLKLPTTQHGRGVAAQVALARRESPARGARFLGLAKTLTTELPHTLAALRTGALSEWRATLIARETTCLSREDRAVVDADLCRPRPDGTHVVDGWGQRRLVAETQRRVYALDPAAVVDRRRRAETERHVSLRPAPDTMSHLSALLPAAQGIAVWATLTRVADSLTAQGDGRGRGQIMADTLVARVTGQTTADTVPVAVNLVVSDQTLLGGGHHPAWLHGYGPLPPDAARHLVTTATQQTTHQAMASLRRLYATPTTGQLVSMDSHARCFPHELGLFLDLRDQTCRTPWCDAPIRHHDHPFPHAAGGPTTAVNGQGLCEACNHHKQAPGWTARHLPSPPGTNNPHTIQTTTPTGHTTRSHAPPQPVPSRVQTRPEYYFHELILAS